MACQARGQQPWEGRPSPGRMRRAWPDQLEGRRAPGRGVNAPTHLDLLLGGLQPLGLRDGVKAQQAALQVQQLLPPALHKLGRLQGPEGGA